IDNACISLTVVCFSLRRYRSGLLRPGCLPFCALALADLFRNGDVACQECIAESRIGSCCDRVAQLPGEAQHEAYIMYTSEAVVKLLFGADEMMDVGCAIMAAGVAVAVLFNRLMNGAEARRLNIDAAIARKKSAVASDARGQDAIKHVHAQTDAHHQIFGRADAEQVPRLMIGQFGRNMAQHFPLLRCWVAHRE